MAADTRPYKSKEQDGQGNELIIRDQQLVEQASQTTMASGEYFEIVDVDGRMAKIPKANMVDIVREALGSLLNGLSDQTTVTKVPSLNGNTLGASTVATLASVLGATVTNGIQRLGLDFVYIPYIYGTGYTPVQIAQDVINKLPDDQKGNGGFVFCGVHEYSGERLFWGYYYGNKNYVNVFVSQYDIGNFYKVTKVNNTYKAYRINGTLEE